MFAPMCPQAHIIRLANIIRRSRHHLPKANIIQKTHLCLGRQKCVFLLVAGVGFFIAPSVRVSHCSASIHSACSARTRRTSLRQKRLSTVFTSLTHSLLRRSWSIKLAPRARKRKNTPRGCVFFFWLREWDLNLTTFGL